MKTLNVATLETGIPQILDNLKQKKEQMDAMKQSIDTFVSDRSSFTGKAAQSIKSFYQETHLEVIASFTQWFATYESTLRSLETSIKSLEPSKDGYISEAFLETELENGLIRAREIVIDLTNEGNAIISGIQDIVSIQKLDDDVAIQLNQAAKENKTKIVDKLNEFDESEATGLESVKEYMDTIGQKVKVVEGMFSSGTVSIGTYRPGSITLPKQPVEKADTSPSANLKDHPRFVDNKRNDTSRPAEEGVSWNPLPTLGLSPSHWRERPLNAAANLSVNASTGYGAAKTIQKSSRGAGVSKKTYETAQGKRRVRVKVHNPKELGFKKKTYSGTNATNYPELYKHVNMKTAIKESFKWSSNKLGYLGVAATVTGDIVHGIQNDASAVDIAADVTGDVAVAGVSIAASAATGAAAGAIIGGPLGLGVGAVAGFVVGMATTSALSDLKFMDVDKDGKQDSIADAAKKGTKKLLKKIGSWF